jgi:pantothenate kinase
MVEGNNLIYTESSKNYKVHVLRDMYILDIYVSIKIDKKTVVLTSL